MGGQPDPPARDAAGRAAAAPSRESAERAAVATETPAEARRGVSRAAHLLAALTMVSRVAGLARDAAIGAVFGAGPGADAFFVAFRIPNLLRRVVAEGATSAAFVPVFTEERANRGDEAALRAAGAVGGAAVLVLLALTVAGMAAAGPLTALFAPGFARDPAKAALTVSLTRWTFPYLLFVGMAAWAMGVHHTFRHFALPAFGPVLMNLAIIAATLALAPWMNEPAWALVVGVLAGGALQASIQLPSLAVLGLRPRMLVAFSHPALRRCGSLMVAAIVGGSIYQVNVLAATVLASLLPAGSVSWLWYADRVFEFPLGIVAVAVGTAALPTLSSQSRDGDEAAMAATVLHAMSLTIAFCLPAAVGLLLLSGDIASLLFERGSFTANDAAMTAMALRAGVPGLVGVGLVRVLSSAFFAMDRARVPVAAGLATLVVHLLLSIALMGPPEPGPAWWGSELVLRVQAFAGIADLRHAGLSLATGLASTANGLLLLAVLRASLPSLHLAPLLRSAALHGAAAFAMAAVVAGWIAMLAEPQTFTALAVRVGGAVVVGTAAYLAAATALGSREIRELLEAARVLGPAATADR